MSWRRNVQTLKVDEIFTLRESKEIISSLTSPPTMAPASINHHDCSITLPNITSWPQDAVHPILDRMNTWFGGFHVTVITVHGHEFRVPICKDELVIDLKRRCAEHLVNHQEPEMKYVHNPAKIPKMLHLVFMGRVLEDDTPIATTLMDRNSVVFLIFRFLGGAKTPSRQPPLLLVNCKFLHRAVPFIPGELVGELKRRISQHYWFRRRYRWANHDDMELRFNDWPLSDDTHVDTLGLYYMGHLVMRLKERKNNPVVKKEDLPLGFIVNFPALLQTFSKNSK
jgi:hypothetical protein